MANHDYSFSYPWVPGSSELEVSRGYKTLPEALTAAHTKMRDRRDLRRGVDVRVELDGRFVRYA